MRALSLPAGRRLLLLDAVLALWVALWIAAGLAVAESVRELSALPSGFTRAGEAIQDAGGAIGGVDIPVVGQPLGAAGDAVRAAGRQVAEEGRAGEEEVDDAARLLGLIAALTPTLPLLALYLPARIARARDAAALRRGVKAAGGDPRFQRFLAERTLVHASHARLRRISEHPWEDFAEGRYGALAGEEMRRLGVRPPEPADPGP